MKPESNSCQIPSWAWATMVILPILSVLIFIYWWITRPSEERMSSVEIDTPYYRKPQPGSHEDDDLTRLKGVGPKIQAALKNEGISSFKLLALADEARLREALSEAGIRISNQDTWPQQARLAALGLWDELAEYQDTI